LIPGLRRAGAGKFSRRLPSPKTLGHVVGIGQTPEFFRGRAAARQL